MTTGGRRISPATVVIQHTIVRKSGYLEYGYPPPYAETIGHGTAVVLRNGKAYKVRWSRPTLEWRHYLHHRFRPADDLRARPGVDSAGRKPQDRGRLASGELMTS